MHCSPVHLQVLKSQICQKSYQVGQVHTHHDILNVQDPLLELANLSIHDVSPLP